MGRKTKASYYQGGFGQGSRHTFPRKKSNMVWVPKVPSWEREFCYKIGSFTWDNFVEAKRASIYHEKVYLWKDSAAEEAFYNAKNRFYAEIKGLPIPEGSHDHNPDLYIDEIDSEAEIDHKLFDELDELYKKRYMDTEKSENNNYEYVPQWPDSPLAVKATGWDVVDNPAPSLYYGMVFGKSTDE